MSLAKTYSSERLEAACSRALSLQSYSYRSVASILKNGQMSAPPPGETRPSQPGPTHETLRGSDYYQ